MTRLLAQVARDTGIRGRAMIRFDDEQSPKRDSGAEAEEHTWMEVYERVPATDLPALLETVRSRAEAQGLSAPLCSQRHVEVFSALV